MNKLKKTIVYFLVVINIFCSTILSNASNEDVNYSSDNVTTDTSINDSILDDDQTLETEEASNDLVNYENIDNSNVITYKAAAASKFSYQLSDRTLKVSISKGYFVSPKQAKLYVWSEIKGQDDIATYTMNLKNNNYECNVNLNSLKHFGIVNLHCYNVNTSNKSIFIGGFTYSFKAKTSKIVIGNEKGLNKSITFSGSTFVNPKYVRAAVWTTSSSQSDLKWFDLSKKSNDVYTYNLNISKYKKYDSYNFHIYAGNSLSNLKFQYGIVKKITKPSIKTVSFNTNVNAGKSVINLTDATSIDNIKTAKVAIWSEDKGQDDLRWYTINFANNVYSQNFDIKNHLSYYGKYNVHLYITDYLGKDYFQSANILDFTKYNEVRSSINSKNEIVMSLSNPKNTSGYSKVVFPIWSETDGQDDIKWVESTKQANGNYKASININNFDNLGIYNIHCYLFNSKNDMKFVGGIKINTGLPKGGKVSVSNFNKTKGTFKINMTNPSYENFVDNVQVAVWSTANGQDDLKWYKLNKDSDGNYSCNASIKNHLYSVGEYNLHAYVYENFNNSKVFQGGITYNVNVSTSALVSTNGNLFDTAEYQKIVVQNIISPIAFKEIDIAIWGNTNGQNDLVWHCISANSATTKYSITVPISSHKENGTYNIHVYGKNQCNQSIILGTTTFKVTEVASLAKINNKTATGLINFCKSKIGTPYLYGTWGQVLTVDLYNYYRNLYGRGCVWDSDIKKVGQVCTDCSGLISWYTGVRRSSSGYFSTATQKVSISQINESMKGWALYMPGHIGVYIGGGKYIAADGSAYGVRIGTLSMQKWTHVIKLKDVLY